MRADEGNHVRFGTRVNSRVPIALQWIEDGKSVSVEAQTTDIRSSGCFVASPQPILVGQQIQLTNLINGKESNAHVVRHGQQSASGWELGIQLESQLDDFWGLDF
jgi:PilZ domain